MSARKKTGGHDPTVGATTHTLGSRPTLCGHDPPVRVTTPQSETWCFTDGRDTHRFGGRVLLAHAPVDNGDAVLLVHHLQDGRLVRGVHRRHRDVAHGSKLAAVVQVLVLQPEEVPHEPPASSTR